ncbi:MULTISPECIES: signal peptidase II [unclassified Marinobacterium]|uniref:signal peptidase II n=1 Tax=unclassified Marinobacterium TaxID=2644139 RepID=UPI001568EC73|nr:Lipoprotein signal peptidase [Marinobacterium sp. xm-g-48]NRP82161.1 Lipoprotein signal peptidase [Marinobacterium sp. xm-d-509]
MSSVTTRNPSALQWLWLSLAIVVLDLGSKALASSMLSYNLPISIFPIFDLRLLHNTGAAFSFLASEAGWQRWLFVTIAVVVSGLIVHWLRQTEPEQKIQAFGYAAILGGALGNLFDRIVHGYVVDFLSFHYAGWYFPAFNIADVGITLGAIALIVDALFLSKDRSK